MRLADMHIHTTFSPDGKSSMEEQCIKAIEIGIPIICFTDHVNQTFFSKYIPNKRSLQFEDREKHAYVRTYKKGKTTLIWGRNHGIPFAHMTIDEINQTIKNFVSNGLLD